MFVGGGVQPARDPPIPVMWFTYGQRNATIPEQRSVTAGRRRVFQVKSAPPAEAVDTVSAGGVGAGEELYQAINPSAPLRWSPLCLNPFFPLQGQTCSLTYCPPPLPQKLQKEFLHHLASFVSCPARDERPASPRQARFGLPGGLGGSRSGQRA